MNMNQRVMFILDLIMMVVSFLSALTLVWLLILGIVPFTWGTAGALFLFLFAAAMTAPSSGGTHVKRPE